FRCLSSSRLSASSPTAMSRTLRPTRACAAVAAGRLEAAVTLRRPASVARAAAVEGGGAAAAAGGGGGGGGGGGWGAGVAAVVAAKRKCGLGGRILRSSTERLDVAQDDLGHFEIVIRCSRRETS